jgi:phosphate-selective porin OprO and OprP
LRKPARHLRAALASGAAASVLVWATASAAASSADEEARIARLEAAVATLQAQVQAQSGVGEENARLKAQVTGLEAQVADLKTSTTEQIQTAHADDIKTIEKAKPSVITTVANGRPVWASPDGKNSVTLRGQVQFDAADYLQPTPPGPLATDLRRSGPAVGATASNVDFTHARELKDGYLLRRARLGVDGQVLGDFQYRILLDFGGTGVENAGEFYEAWIQYSGFKPFKLKVGEFPPLQGLEDQMSTSQGLFLERPAVANIARDLAGGDTRLSAQTYATGQTWLASVALTSRTIGVLNTGNATPTPQTYGDPLGVVARLAFSPLKGEDYQVQVGANGSYVIDAPNVGGPPTTFPPSASTLINQYQLGFSDRLESRVDGTRLINTGNIGANHASTTGGEFAAQWRNFFLQGEFQYFTIARRDPTVVDPHFFGWYVEGSWILTGQSRRYNQEAAVFDGPAIPKPVGGGGIGDFELAFRFSDMNLNYQEGLAGTLGGLSTVRGGDSKIFSTALNWYLNPPVRLSFEYQYVNLVRLSPDPTVYQTLPGAEIGQNYSVISMRTQFAF